MAILTYPAALDYDPSRDRLFPTAPTGAAGVSGYPFGV